MINTKEKVAWITGPRLALVGEGHFEKKKKLCVYGSW